MSRRVAELVVQSQPIPHCPSAQIEIGEGVSLCGHVGGLFRCCPTGRLNRSGAVDTMSHDAEGALVVTGGYIHQETVVTDGAPHTGMEWWSEHCADPSGVRIQADGDCGCSSLDVGQQESGKVQSHSQPAGDIADEISTSHYGPYLRLTLNSCTAPVTADVVIQTKLLAGIAALLNVVVRSPVVVLVTVSPPVTSSVPVPARLLS